MRNDYNIIISVLIVIIINRFYNESPMFYSKVIIHLLGLFILCDILWCCFVIPMYFQNGSSYWNGLIVMKWLTITFTIANVLIKIIMLILIFTNFKKEYPNQLTYLKLFDYFTSLSLDIQKK